MKRSEMEAAFTKIIKQYSSIKFKDAPELASRLLTLAMNIGMLPPKHPTKRVNEISLLRPAYMWEDEDDKRD